MSHPGKTLHLGKVWVDFSAGRAFGLPSAAYLRADAQSDSLQALLASPWYMTPDSRHVGEVLDQVSIPWATRGCLLWSLSVAECYAPLAHKSMSDLERMEASVTGFLLWDMWTLMSARTEASRDLNVGACSMASETIQNIQAIALATIVLLLTKPDA